MWFFIRGFSLFLLFQACGCAVRGGVTVPDVAACDDFVTDTQKVWNRRVKADVQAKMYDLGGSLGVDVASDYATKIVTTMDRFTSDWVLLRRTACLDHFKRGIGSDQDYAARGQCLDEMLMRQRTALSQIASNAGDMNSILESLEMAIQRCR